MTPWRFIIAIILLCAATAGAQDDILQLISTGQVAKARRLLSLAPASASHDPQWLYFEGLVEPDAARAAQMLQAALDASAPAQYHDDIYTRLGQYYAQCGLWDKLKTLSEQYRSKYDKGSSRPILHRLGILAAEQAGDTVAALQLANQFVTRYVKKELAQWGMLDKCRLTSGSEPEARIKLLKSLVAEASGDALAAAHYGLIAELLEMDSLDAALRQYELFREQYPLAVGIEYLEERFRANRSTSDDQSPSPEVPTKWTIKAGVFSVEANARELGRRIEQAGVRSEVGTKVISGKTHYIVYCGQYETAEAAETARTKLTQRFGESLQVVAR